MISGEFSKLPYEKVYRLAVVVLIPAWPAWPPTCATVRRSLARGPAGRNGSRWASKVSRRDFRGQSPLPKSAQCWERAGRPEATAGLAGRAWCPSLGPVAAPPPPPKGQTQLLCSRCVRAAGAALGCTCLGPRPCNSHSRALLRAMRQCMRWEIVGRVLLHRRASAAALPLPPVTSTRLGNSHVQSLQNNSHVQSLQNMCSLHRLVTSSAMRLARGS